MGKRITTWGAIALMVALGGALAGERARAGDEDGHAHRAGHWVYDLRVVRVDPPTPEGAEAPSPFADLRGRATKTPWRDALGLLKGRGRTTILMDQDVTALDGRRTAAGAERTVSIVLVNFVNKSDEQKRATTVRSGCKLEVTPGREDLAYEVQVQWNLDPASSTAAPQQFQAFWSGTHPHLDGETLVLHYAEQVPVTKGGAPRAVEIYALLTGRFISR